MSDKLTVHEGLAQVMQALSYIPKGRSPGVSYEFRGIDAVMNHLHGPLADAGLFLSPRVMDDWAVTPIPGSPDRSGNPRTQFQATFRVCVDVHASDGSMVTLGPGLAQSHDYGDKAVYQAQQNAIKYVLLEAFAIPTAEQDMDSRPADDVPMFNLSEFATEQVGQFADWSEDERKEQWKAALIGGNPHTLAEAEGVIERMRVAYDGRETS